MCGKRLTAIKNNKPIQEVVPIKVNEWYLEEAGKCVKCNSINNPNLKKILICVNNCGKELQTQCIDREDLITRFK